MDARDLTRPQLEALLRRLRKDAGYYEALRARMTETQWPLKDLAKLEHVLYGLRELIDTLGPVPVQTFDLTAGHESWSAKRGAPKNVRLRDGFREQCRKRFGK